MVAVAAAWSRTRRTADDRADPDQAARAGPQRCRLVWGNPGTRLGMWSHFTSQFSMTVFAMLWGFPFLVRGQGLSPTTASTLLMVMTALGRGQPGWC